MLTEVISRYVPKLFQNNQYLYAVCSTDAQERQREREREREIERERERVRVSHVDLAQKHLGCPRPELNLTSSSRSPTC